MLKIKTSLKFLIPELKCKHIQLLNGYTLISEIYIKHKVKVTDMELK